MSGKSRTAVAADEAERRLAPPAARRHGVVSREQLRRAGLTEYAIGAAVESATAPGRRGVGTLRKLVDEWRRAAPVAKQGKLKSPLEAMVLPLLASRGIETPRPNAPVTLADGSRIEVDFLWAERRFVLEADSRDFHGTEVAFERDRRRDRELMRIGYSTLRVTKLQAESEAEAVADAILARLDPD